jgi:hypothetical protein
MAGPKMERAEIVEVMYWGRSRGIVPIFYREKRSPAQHASYISFKLIQIFGTHFQRSFIFDVKNTNYS